MLEFLLDRYQNKLLVLKRLLLRELSELESVYPEVFE